MADPVNTLSPSLSEEKKKSDEVSTSLPVYDTERGSLREIVELLHPKPTTDPLDPLNFSKAQKLLCLSIVMALYFLFTWITTVTVPSFPLLQTQYGISYAQVNWTVALPALGLMLGPLLWSSLADIYGRRVVFIVGTVIALVATIGAAVARNYSGYMAARFFQGFGVAPASTVGLAIINDLFFEHERGQKVGMWTLAIDMGLLVGPLIGGFITEVSQQWCQWLSALMFAAVLLLEVFLLPETLYPRSLMLSRMPAAITGEQEKAATADVYGDLPRTRRLPFLNVRKVPGIGAQKHYNSLLYFLKCWSYPNLAIIICVYGFAWYWWILTVITYLPVAYSQYSPSTQGLLFLGLILGTLFSELLCSGRLSDRLMAFLTARNGGTRVPEMRLWLCYPAVTLTAVGLILWGISVDMGMHWMVGQVALFLFGAGIQIGNTAISAYVVDCYPLHALSVIVYYAVTLNASAFVSPYFIEPWVQAVGFTWTFAAQGVISFVVVVPVTALLQRYGRRMSEWKGPPTWVSPEYST